MRVRDVMSKQAYRLRVWQELEIPGDLWRFQRASHFPVLDIDDRLVGMVTRGDVLDAALEVRGPTRLPVTRVMHSPAVAITGDATLEEAAERMRSRHVHALPVVRPGGGLEGVVSQSDLLAALAREAQPPEDVPVDLVMTPDPTALLPEATLREAVAAMRRGGFRHLPVVDRAGELLGMISELDLRERIGGSIAQAERLRPDVLGEPVGEVMDEKPRVVRSGARVREVVPLFSDRRSEALPVVDADGKVLGVLSYVDLIAWLEAEAPEARQPGASPLH